MRRIDLELDRERRNQILDASLHCFLQLEYEGTFIDDVARKPNLSRSLIYLKFKSKQDLLSGLYVDFNECASRVRERFKVKNPHER